MTKRKKNAPSSSRWKGKKIKILTGNNASMYAKCIGAVAKLL